MTVDQLPGRVREFANYLNGLLARLDQGGGWCAVFWQRDPDGMQACLGGREVPPWDVVEALLQDLAIAYGTEAAAHEAEQARPLHASALTAHDARPGAREDLSDRLDGTLREQRYAAERLDRLGRALGSAHSHEEAEALTVDLAWARDDHERASARCAELRARLERLDARTGAGDLRGSAPRVLRGRTGGAALRADDEFPTGGTPVSGAAAGEPVPDGASVFGAAVNRSVADDSAAGGSLGFESVADEAAVSGSPPRGPAAPGHASYDPQADFAAAEPATDDSGAASETGATRYGRRAEPTTDDGTPASAPVPAPAPAKQRKRRRGSARFAGMAADEAAPSVVPQTPEVPVPTAPTGRRTPRGARFAGAAETPVQPEPVVERPDQEAGQAVAEAVQQLVRLRAEGRTGEAHALLAEVAQWPAARLPQLADALQRAGLGADWATLLWEAASLPPARLVAVADALTVAGRTADGSRILRQGVVRPATEMGEAVLALDTEGRHREARALLDAYVQVRTPEEAAHCAEPDPHRLVPLLLDAAQTISEQRRWDLLHALRVAGFAS
ncbi:hypothetical protein ACFV2H_32190 [Streptomyces sp. NPDC059629]|uniref:hypothetical protein n=1 Tax=Streptomyces sp. NPDC059629 TaxID=3346889 RepID=UPI003694EB08